jgi:hypothetical protein
MWDEMAKASSSNGASHSISETNHELLSKMKTEAAKTHTEFIEAKSAISKCMLCCLCRLICLNFFSPILSIIFSSSYLTKKTI